MGIKTQSSKLKAQNHNLNPKTKPEIRYLNDMKETIYDKKWLKNAPNYELYYMYRDIERKNGLRYDITAFQPRMLGKEFVKTKGHEHSENYGEVYIVLKGIALYLVQKYKDKKIEDVYAVKAKKGEVVIIPPGYGHITINPTKKELIEANWLNIKCKNVYDLFIKNKGACYFYTKNGWIKNKNYENVPKLRFKKPLKKMPVNLKFLHGK